MHPAQISSTAAASPTSANPEYVSRIQLHTSVPSPSPIKQIDGVQILRAVAVTQVAWTHSFQQFGQYGTAGLPTFGIVGIDIFFVISGFIISSIVLHSRQAPGPRCSGQFLKRRFIRIYPIYWIYAAVGLLRLVHNGSIYRANYIPAFFLVPWPKFAFIYGLTWTLMFELMFYFTVGILLLWTVRWAIPTVVTLFGILGLFGCIRPPTATFWILPTNPMLLEFVFGAILALLFRRLGRQRLIGIPFLILGIAGIVFLQYHQPPGAYSMAQILTGEHVGPRPFTWGVASALLVGGMVFWSPQIRSRLGLLAVVIGNASYSAYLASTPLLEFTYRGLAKLVPPRFPLGLPITLLYSCGITFAVLLVGWLSYQFLEWPLVHRLQRLTA